MMQDNQITNYKALYEKLIKLNSKIRFVTIIDFDGRLMFRAQKDGITSHLDPKDREKSMQHALQAWRLRERFVDEIGAGKYAFAEYGKIKRIVMPIDKEHLIIITTEIEEDHNSIIEQILRMKNE